MCVPLQSTPEPKVVGNIRKTCFKIQLYMQTTLMRKSKDSAVTAIVFNKESCIPTSSDAGNPLPGPASISFRCFFAMACIATHLVFTHQAHAQQHVRLLEHKHQFRVGVGIDYLKTVDLQCSPNVYQSVRTNLQLGYSNRSEKGMFFATLNGYYGALTPGANSGSKVYAKETDIYGSEETKSLDLAYAQLGGNLEIGYLGALTKSATSRAAFYAGGSVQENLTLAMGVLSIGTINYVSLTTKARVDYRLGNGRPLRFDLSFPALSVVTRLPYHGAPAIPGKSNTQAFFTGSNTLETARRFQNLHLSVTYNWLVRKHVSLDITCQTSWMHYYKPQHLTQAGSQISTGLTF